MINVGLWYRAFIFLLNLKPLKYEIKPANYIISKADIKNKSKSIRKTTD